jgi:hypothetical protein
LVVNVNGIGINVAIIASKLVNQWPNSNHAGIAAAAGIKKFDRFGTLGRQKDAVHEVLSLMKLCRLLLCGNVCLQGCQFPDNIGMLRCIGSSSGFIDNGNHAHHVAEVN